MSLPLKRTQETILLVENEPSLLKFIRLLLEESNFTVLSAASAKEALRIEADFARDNPSGTIHLLLSGVMNMTGPDLAKKLKERRPGMHVMLMSGYPDGALLVLNHGWYFIEKPFVRAALMNKINEVLQNEIYDQGSEYFDTLLASQQHG